MYTIKTETIQIKVDVQCHLKMQESSNQIIAQCDIFK